MTMEEIFKTMQDLIAEQFAIDADEISMDSSFVDDLGADSVDLVELVMAMEEEFEIGEVQEEDTTRWADATADPLIIQGIADASAKFDTAMVDGTLYAVFNGIWSRQTDYFTVPGGSLTITGYGTAEGTQKFKVALWKKVDGGVEYVPDSTYYIKTDGTDYTCTISGLDPAAIYRMTISYDSSRYYLYGLMKVEGIG